MKRRASVALEEEKDEAKKLRHEIDTVLQLPSLTETCLDDEAAVGDEYSDGETQLTLLPSSKACDAKAPEITANSSAEATATLPALPRKAEENTSAAQSRQPKLPPHSRPGDKRKGGNLSSTTALGCSMLDVQRNILEAVDAYMVKRQKTVMREVEAIMEESGIIEASPAPSSSKMSASCSTSSTSSASMPAQFPKKKQKLTQSEELMTIAINKLKNIGSKDYQFAVHGTVVAKELRQMDSMNRKIAWKLINDALFLGSMGVLRPTAVINND